MNMLLSHKTLQVLFEIPHNCLRLRTTDLQHMNMAEISKFDKLPERHGCKNEMPAGVFACTIDGGFAAIPDFNFLSSFSVKYRFNLIIKH